MYLLYLHIWSIICLPNPALDMLIFKIILDPLAAKKLHSRREGKHMKNVNHYYRVRMTRRNKNNILLSWSYSRPPRLSLDLPTLPPVVFTMIHSIHSMLWRYPHVHIPWPPHLQLVACRGGPPGTQVLLGPVVSSKDPRRSLRVVGLNSKDMSCDLMISFLFRCPR